MSFNKSIGGGSGSGGTRATSVGLSSLRGGTGSAVTGPVLASGTDASGNWEAGEVPGIDPNRGVGNPGDPARFPMLKGRGGRRR